VKAQASMTTDMVILPKATYNILQQLTGETRPDRALSLALKDLIQLKLESVENQIKVFEKKYDLNFSSFEQKFQADEIADSYSYEVEQDYLYWEAAMGDLKALRKIAKWQA
jgi:hypothetical protein